MHSPGRVGLSRSEDEGSALVGGQRGPNKPWGSPASQRRRCSGCFGLDTDGARNVRAGYSLQSLQSGHG